MNVLMASDFDNIVLNKNEYSVLKMLNKKHIAFIDTEIARPLSLYKLIIPHYTGVDDYGDSTTDGRYEIVDSGKRYLQYKVQRSRDKVLSDLRGWITTVIAVLGFILAIIDLVINIGQSQK